MICFCRSLTESPLHKLPPPALSSSVSVIEKPVIEATKAERKPEKRASLSDRILADLNMSPADVSSSVRRCLCHRVLFTHQLFFMYSTVNNGI